jgi:hypothetical protein
LGRARPNENGCERPPAASSLAVWSKQEVTITKTSDYGITRMRREEQAADKNRAQLAQ